LIRTADMSANAMKAESEITETADFDALVQAVLAGDREAYRQVIIQSEARVRVVVAAILPDPSVVQDIAQEVYVTGFYKLGEYRPGSDFLAWVTTIARNLALNERRRWLRRERFKGRFEAQMEEHLDGHVTHTAEHLGGDAVVALRECLDGLAGQARSVTEDFYFKDKSSEEIAQQHKRQSGWVRLVLFRARAALAECLHAKGVMPDAKPT
jgi:RNA polymerase sigma-70 factor (ECF subfamily)